MSIRNGRVHPELIAEGYSIQLTKPPRRLAGFVVQALIDENSDFCRASVFTIARQPGARHSIIATEQYVTAYDGVPYYDGKPQPVALDYARENMSHVFDSSESNIPALLIIEQLKR